ncbi:PIG-L family deacetylase [Rhizobium sp. RU36D]|uniref:PIG-L family deacetylase n=1 Tax=Rhizobium sp. RU36D TaxID=1907415 RepID=UPI0009D7DBBA|nr:PIG-L family deacetylase [Rhizobium sp. RU36D]SMD15350.1 N-acetylglucosaminyl deacetylase, LmbE family [Rhizobium sp. RU36D]
MLTARERIERQMAAPAMIRLHRALSRLSSTVTVMNTGAHPDDEQSGMLAYFRLGLGMRVVIACSTRGEGGQNALGPERLGALGVVRSREMEEAARVLDADIAWLGHGPDDPVHDFGFSKDGDQTFVRWGEERTVERLVRAYRRERPDIVIPTFLDVPGQHGHHRAMTRAAERAIALAADPSAYPEHREQGLSPWQVAKYYLPAWSGAGDAYDDELPPPDTTVTVTASGVEPATGAQYDRIGEWSRYYHASQGMGRWPENADRHWPLHLKIGASGGLAESDILDHLPASLASLAQEPGLSDALAAHLSSADRAISAALAAFPNRESIQPALIRAAHDIEAVLTSAPPAFIDLHGHRLRRKLVEIDAALVEAAGIDIRAWSEPATISPGGKALLTVAVSGAPNIDVMSRLPAGVTVDEKSSFPAKVEFTLSCDADAALTGLFLPQWSALGGNGHGGVTLSAEIGGRSVTTTIDLEEPFAISPAHSITLKPDTLILPLDGSGPPLSFGVDMAGRTGDLGLRLPSDWAVEASSGGWSIKTPTDVEAGDFSIIPTINGQPAQRVMPLEYRHIGRTAFRSDEVLHVLALDLKLPDNARIGYVSGGADRVGAWMKRMGLDVTELDASALVGDLSVFTTIVIGIFAFGTRPDLAAATGALHRFVEEGGHLVTLYHRPSDGWNPQETPPRPLSIGLPSLRWRVTDPRAEVTVLLPEHPLLTGPNTIGPDDWDGWNKERGLYFASRWDDAYEPLLAMHDPGEQPLKGALLSAAIGKGRHTHTSLVLHHQLDKRVPGAFRLLANLVQPAHQVR